MVLLRSHGGDRFPLTFTLLRAVPVGWGAVLLGLTAPGVHVAYDTLLDLPLRMAMEIIRSFIHSFSKWLAKAERQRQRTSVLAERRGLWWGGDTGAHVCRAGRSPAAG